MDFCGREGWLGYAWGLYCGVVTTSTFLKRGEASWVLGNVVGDGACLRV